MLTFLRQLLKYLLKHLSPGDEHDGDTEVGDSRGGSQPYEEFEDPNTDDSLSYDGMMFHNVVLIIIALVQLASGCWGGNPSTTKNL